MHQLEWWECPRLTPARCLRQRAPPCEGGRGQKPKAKEKCADFALCRLLRVSKFMWSAWQKKKEMRMLVHCRILLAFSISLLDVCIKEIARFFSFVALPTTLLADPSWFEKKNHTREMQMLRRLFVGNGRARCYFLAELYLLLVMDWRLLWVLLVGFFA